MKKLAAFIKLISSLLSVKMLKWEESLLQLRLEYSLLQILPVVLTGA
jgi:hypothetical protein